MLFVFNSYSGRNDRQNNNDIRQQPMVTRIPSRRQPTRSKSDSKLNGRNLTIPWHMYFRHIYKAIYVYDFKLPKYKKTEIILILRIIHVVHVLIAGGKAGSYYSVINDAAVTRVVAPEPVQGYYSILQLLS